MLLLLGESLHGFLVSGFHVAGHAHGVLQREALHAGQRLQAELLSAVHPELQGDIRRYEHRDTCMERRKQMGEDTRGG